MAATSLHIPCPHCGLPFGELSGGARCANCDLCISDLLRLERLTEDGCVAIDTPCVGCDYNLRTLHAEANCPECATPVVKTLWRSELRFASTEWLENLRRATRLLRLGFLVLVILLVGGWLMEWSNVNLWIHLLWYYIGSTVASADLAAGSVRISRLDPLKQASVVPLRWRLLRGAAVASFLLYLLSSLYPLANYVFIHSLRELFTADAVDVLNAAGAARVPWWLLYIATVLLSGATWLLNAWRLRDLARQSGEPRTLRSAKALTYFVVPCVLLDVLQLLFYLTITFAGWLGGFVNWFTPLRCMQFVTSAIACTLAIRAYGRLQRELIRIISERAGQAAFCRGPALSDFAAPPGPHPG